MSKFVKFPLNLRKKIEVLIFKNGLVCICEPTDTQPWYGFPGGGIDDGESIIEAAKRECLEEAGISIKNVEEPFPDYRQVYKSDKPFGSKNYDGTELRYVVATYEKVDKRLFGSEGDGRPIHWYTTKEAIELFGKGNEFDLGRKEFLLKL